MTEFKHSEEQRAAWRAYYRRTAHRSNVTKIATAQRYRQTEAGKANALASQRRTLAKYPQKFKARITLRNAVAAGKLTKGPCEICGETDVQGHHDDYSKPLEVRWLCRQHHCELEGRWTPGKVKLGEEG